MSIKNWFLLIFLSMLWGGSFFFVEIALEELPIFVIVFFRVFIGFLFLFIFSLITKRKMVRDKNILLSFFIMGLINNVIPFSMIVSGQKYISGGLASILNSATPFITVIIAHFFTTDEKVSINKIVGLILGVFGVVILIGLNPLNIEGDELIGILSILTASTSYACAGIFGRKFKKYNLDPVVTSTGQLFSSSILLLPLMLFIDKPWNIKVLSGSSLGAILGIALFSTSIAYIIYFKILSSAGATNVLLVTFLVPVSAVLLGVLFLSEEFNLRQGLGMIIIGLGLLFIDGRVIKKQLS